MYVGALANEQDEQMAEHLAENYRKLTSSYPDVYSQADLEVASAHRFLIKMRQGNASRARKILARALWLYQSRHNG